MSPERKKKIGQYKIEEFYWAGRMVVYVDNQKVDGNFEDVCAAVEGALDHEFEQSTLRG